MTENGTRARRRKEILKAATEEFSQHGFEGTRVEAVAKRAGIGKSTVYEYYPLTLRFGMERSFIITSIMRFVLDIIFLSALKN